MGRVGFDNWLVSLFLLLSASCDVGKVRYIDLCFTEHEKSLKVGSGMKMRIVNYLLCKFIFMGEVSIHLPIGKSFLDTPITDIMNTEFSYFFKSYRFCREFSCEK